MKLSILIPTLFERKRLLDMLLMQLALQIAQSKLEDEVEVLTLPDNREATVGAKRNTLIDKATGDFVVFVDDDDVVADDYVRQLHEAIVRNPDADCIGLRGILTRAGNSSQRQVIYSIHYPGPFESGGIYYRPPCHLTPVRRDIAARYKYAEVNLGEDASWSLNVAADKALKSEYFVDKILYQYRFDPKMSGTQKNYNVPVPNPSAADRWKVVILSARADNLTSCIASLLENEPGLTRDRIVVVDDGAYAGFDKKAHPGIVWTQGKKPFNYAMNANVGMTTAKSSVFLLNDDARLGSRFGLSSLAYAVHQRPEIGICSAAVQGVAGGAGQAPAQRLAGIRDVSNVAFVCAYITRAAIEKIGFLDEQFTGYGFEDNDYCLRAAKGAMVTSVYDGCLVLHDRPETSSFRSKPDWKSLMAMNRSLFEKKWGTSILPPAPAAEAAPVPETTVKGQEFFDKEEYEAAIPYFVASSKTSDDPVEKSQAMMQLARCHAHMGRLDTAETWFNAATEAAPGRREIPFYYAVCLIRSRLLEHALVLLDACLAIPASRRPFSAYDLLTVWDGSLPLEAKGFCTKTIDEAKAKARADA